MPEKIAVGYICPKSIFFFFWHIGVRTKLVSSKVTSLSGLQCWIKTHTLFLFLDGRQSQQMEFKLSKTSSRNKGMVKVDG